jgi:hypothetical protein
MEILQPYIDKKKKKKKTKRQYRQHPAGTIIQNPYTATAFGQYAQPTFYQIPQYISPYEQNSRILKNLETMVDEQKSLPTKIGSTINDFMTQFSQVGTAWQDDLKSAPVYDPTDPVENVLMPERDDQSAFSDMSREPHQPGTIDQYTQAEIPWLDNQIRHGVKTKMNSMLNEIENRQPVSAEQLINEVPAIIEKQSKKTSRNYVKELMNIRQKDRSGALNLMSNDQINALYEKLGGETGRGKTFKVKKKYILNKWVN